MTLASVRKRNTAAYLIDDCSEYRNVLFFCVGSSSWAGVDAKGDPIARKAWAIIAVN